MEFRENAFLDELFPWPLQVVPSQDVSSKHTDQMGILSFQTNELVLGLEDDDTLLLKEDRTLKDSGVGEKG